MKWLITGGTGFIGKALVSVLTERGEDVVVVSRRKREVSNRVRHVGWSEGLDQVDGMDVVVHLAGAGIADRRWTEERVIELKRSRIDTGRDLSARIAAAVRKPRVYVSGSAMGIYGMRRHGDGSGLDADEVLDENGSKGSDLLTEICVAWEASADEARAAGVRVVHPRTGLVLGLGEGVLGKMVPAFRAFVGGPIGEGLQWMSFIHIEDEVRALLFLVDHAELEGPFNLTAPHPVTMNDFARTLGKVLGRPHALRAPGFALKLAMGKMADAALSGQRVVPKKLQGAGFVFRYPDLTSALTKLLLKA